MPNILHSAMTGADLHEPKGASGANANTVYVFDGGGNGTAQKVTRDQLTGDASNGTINLLTFEFEDISSAASRWIVCPFAGDIQKIWSVLDGAITGANCGFTFEIGGTAVTDAAITITQSGSAAGDVDSSTPTAAKTLTAGQPIEITSDGGSTGAKSCTFTFEITPS